MFITLTIEASGEAADIEKYLTILTPFNIDNIADSLKNSNFKIGNMVIYLKSNNPLIDRCIKKTIAKYNNFPNFFSSYEFKDSKISYKLIQVWHFYMENFPDYKIDNPVINKFSELCHSHDNIIKRSCADVLKYFDEEKIINLLCLLLDEEDIKVNIFAINSLSYLKNKNCIEKIKKLKNKRNFYIDFTIKQYFINIKQN